MGVMRHARGAAWHAGLPQPDQLPVPHDPGRWQGHPPNLGSALGAHLGVVGEADEIWRDKVRRECNAVCRPNEPDRAGDAPDN